MAHKGWADRIPDDVTSYKVGWSRVNNDHKAFNKVIIKNITIISSSIRPVKFSDVLFDSGSILIMESQFEKFMLILVFFQIHKWCEYLSLYFFFILRPINLNTFFQIKNRNSVSVSMEFLLYFQPGDGSIWIWQIQIQDLKIPRSWEIAYWCEWVFMNLTNSNSKLEKP